MILQLFQLLVYNISTVFTSLLFGCIHIICVRFLTSLNSDVKSGLIIDVEQ